MKDYKEIIESEQTPTEIFESLNEKTAAGNIPRTGDYLRVLEDISGFAKGDELEVVTFTDTSKEGNMDSFTLGVKSNGEGAKSGTLTLERGDIDKKFQMVYDS